MSTLQSRFQDLEPWTVTEAERDQVEAEGAKAERERLVAEYHATRERYYLACDVASDPQATPSQRAIARRRKRTLGRKYYRLRSQVRAHGFLSAVHGERRRLL